VYFTNIDLRLIQVVSKLLENFGIAITLQGPFKPNPPGKKPYYRLQVKPSRRFYSLLE